jgi:hypothetical protein
VKPFSTQPTQTQEAPNIIPVTLANELTIFAEATAMPDLDDRRAYLDRTCGGNPVLRQKVEERIAAQDVANLLQSASRIPDDAFEDEASASDEMKPPVATPEPSRAQQSTSSGASVVTLNQEQVSALVSSRSSSIIPWVFAVLFAVLAGVCAVCYFHEKEARIRAEDMVMKSRADVEELGYAHR